MGGVPPKRLQPAGVGERAHARVEDRGPPHAGAFELVLVGAPQIQAQIIPGGCAAEPARQRQVIVARRREGADDLAGALKQAERGLKTDEAAVAAERSAITTERAENDAIVKACAAERAAIVATMSPNVVSLFDKLARARGGIGIARAEKERCIVCQVRLRPMVFSAVVRNDEIVQCDSCQRILYFVPPSTTDAATPGSDPPAAS
jgi:hypothetical protein